VSVRDALLALLDRRPAYGYELKADFEAATGDGWPLNIGQVYSTLQRCERDDLATAQDEADDQGRRLWTISAEGREAVASWLETPAAPIEASRDAFSLKVLMAIEARPDQVDDLIRDQRNATMSELQALTRDKATVADGDLARQLHLDRSVLLVEAQVRWLDMVEARIDTHGKANS
jgi:DNA-binding PadR family transcriptional regulator